MRDPHHCDLVRGGFQTIEGSVAPRSECGVASLTTKGLDSLDTAMIAISNQSVYSIVSDAKVRALMVRIGESLGVHPDGVRHSGFSPHSKDAQKQVLAFQPERERRRDDRGGNHVDSGAMPQTVELLCILAVALDGAGPSRGQHRTNSSMSEK